MSGPMKTKVRVKRAELSRIVAGRLAKAEKDHERAVAAYPAKVEAWERSCIARLEKALADAKRGKLPTNRYSDPGVTLDSRPVKPSDNGRELCNLRRLLKTLQIGSDDAILLSQEDADAYFGPCRL